MLRSQINKQFLSSFSIHSLLCLCPVDVSSLAGHTSSHGKKASYKQIPNQSSAPPDPPVGAVPVPHLPSTPQPGTLTVLHLVPRPGLVEMGQNALHRQDALHQAGYNHPYESLLDLSCTPDLRYLAHVTIRPRFPLIDWTALFFSLLTMYNIGIKHNNITQNIKVKWH